MNEKIACAYIRVSTENQTELSPDSQIKTVREFARQKGFIIPNDFIFRDDGISGRTADKRPQFKKMIAIAKEKPSPFSAIFVWKYSRFARNQEEAVFYKGMLKKIGIEVISTSEPIIDGPFGSLIERIIEWFDEYYSINLSTEVKRGMRERVSRGGAVSIPAFGYDIVDKEYVINPVKAEIVRKIFGDFLLGKSCNTIAQELNNIGILTSKGNRWEKRTVEYILYNPVYTGKIRWNPSGKTGRNFSDKNIMIVKGTHTPIIEDKIFTEAQKKLAQNKSKYPPHTTDRKGSKDYMLKGLVKCSSCGGKLSLGSNNSLQCINYSHGKCGVSHYISLSILNDIVLSLIEKQFNSDSFTLTKNNYLPRYTEVDLDLLIKGEMAKIERIQEAYESGAYSLSQYRDRKQKVLEEISILKNKITPPHMSAQNNSKTLCEKEKILISQLKSEKISEREKNELLKSFIREIVYNKTLNSVDIYFYC